jgi:hypothetical protein
MLFQTTGIGKYTTDVVVDVTVEVWTPLSQLLIVVVALSFEKDEITVVVVLIPEQSLTVLVVVCPGTGTVTFCVIVLVETTF